MSRKKWQQFHKLEKKARALSYFSYVNNEWLVEIDDAETDERLHTIHCKTINDAKKGTRGLLKSIADRRESK